MTDEHGPALDAASDALPDDLARQLWAGMNRFVTAHDPHAELRRELGLGRGRGRIRVLLLLATGPKSPRDIAQATTFEPPYVTAIIDQLERLGLSEKSDHPEDRRRKIVELTPAGHDAARRAQAIIDRPPPQLAAMSAHELRPLADFLGRLNDDTSNS